MKQHTIPYLLAGASGSTGQTGATGQMGATGVTGEWRLDPEMMWVLCRLYAGCVEGQVGSLHQ